MSTDSPTPHDPPHTIPQLTQHPREFSGEFSGESGEIPRRVGENPTPSDPNAHTPRGRLGVDWTAVLVAAVVVAVALFGLLPSIPFLVK